jgi:uncharacterized protein with HEPN domain
MTVEACLYNIQIIGEAVSKLPEEVRTDNPHIPWMLIKGMRNRLIHDSAKYKSPLFLRSLFIIFQHSKNETKKENM